MATIKQTMTNNRAAASRENKATHDLLETILNRLGEPDNGPAHPASGVYFVVEKVSARLLPFEQRWEQVKGGLAALGVVGLPVGALIWFLSGDKLTKILGG